MNILAILQLVAVIIPAAADLVAKILTAIHSAPGSPEHSEAVNSSVSLSVPAAPVVEGK